MVLELSHQNLVTFAETGAPPTLRDEIDRFGRSARKHHLGLLGRVEEAADLFARLLETHGRALREEMDRSVDVGAVPRVDVGDRVDHRLRLERGRRTVEVDQWLPVHVLMKRGEVFPHAPRVERRGARGCDERGVGHATPSMSSPCGIRVSSASRMRARVGSWLTRSTIVSKNA